jgi:hypothetical protein
LEVKGRQGLRKGGKSLPTIQLCSKSATITALSQTTERRVAFLNEAFAFAAQPHFLFFAAQPQNFYFYF